MNNSCKGGLNVGTLWWKCSYTFAEVMNWTQNIDVQLYEKHYLINGTGNAWAWHNRAKSSDVSRTNVQLFVSLAKVGALAPTGSIRIKIGTLIRKSMTETWMHLNTIPCMRMPLCEYNNERRHIISNLPY